MSIKDPPLKEASHFFGPNKENEKKRHRIYSLNVDRKIYHLK
jgi:hypothetical protein